MRTLLLFTLFVLSLPKSQEILNVYAKEKYDKQKFFDNYGRYQGQIDKGKFYSPKGKLQWTITKDGKIYDPYGKYLGKFEK
jgi:hypothetical protein|tara:strand:+ start:1609 stop:1851 length:243 start_codon:yes stop_codon:yes gene_type:complete